MCMKGVSFMTSRVTIYYVAYLKHRRRQLVIYNAIMATTLFYDERKNYKAQLCEKWTFYRVPRQVLAEL